VQFSKIAHHVFSYAVPVTNGILVKENEPAWGPGRCEEELQQYGAEEVLKAAWRKNWFDVDNFVSGQSDQEYDRNYKGNGRYVQLGQEQNGDI
jgi:hypothetical protein